MSLLGNPKRIVKEDYPAKYHDLIEGIGFVLNSFMEESTAVLNGNVDFDNLAQEKLTFDMTADGSGTPIGNALFKTGIANPSGIQVIRAIDKDNTSIFASSQPFISYSPQDDTRIIKVNNITGLTASRTYRLTVIIYK